MKPVFNADEIFQMAINIEQYGERFYRRFAKATSDLSINQLFNELADMEAEHERTFIAMQKQSMQSDWDHSLLDADDLTSSYLRALSKGIIFDQEHDPLINMTGEETLEEIFNIAIQREKDSVIFYLGMKDLVPADFGKDQIDKIIKEEMSHIVLLSEKLSELR